MRQKNWRPQLHTPHYQASMTWKEVVDMTKCKHQYDEAEQRIEHLASQHMRCKLCHNLIFQGREWPNYYPNRVTRPFFADFTIADFAVDLAQRIWSCNDTWGSRGSKTHELEKVEETCEVWWSSGKRRSNWPLVFLNTDGMTPIEILDEYLRKDQMKIGKKIGISLFTGGYNNKWWWLRW